MRSSIVLASLLSISAPLSVPATAVAQDVNPYGRIDPIDASASVLRQAIGPTGVPGAIVALDDANAPDVARLLELLLDHPASAMRTTAAVRAAAHGADPRRLHDRLQDEDARGAFVVGLLGDDRLSPEVADLLLAGVSENTAPVATAILAARSEAASRLERLATIAGDSDAPPLARGIAAGALEDSTSGSVAAWLATLADRRAEDRDRAIFEAVTALEPLGATAGIRAVLAAVADRPADDALRAAVVFALLQLDPKSGLQAWSALAENTATDRAIPNAMLLVSAGVDLPSDAARRLPANDDLQQAVRAMIIAAPADRPARSIDAVRLGHLPTIRWLLELPASEVPPDVLDAMIEAGLTHRRTAMIDVLLKASALLASSDPNRLARRLGAAADDESLREVILRGLIAAGTAEAAEIARTAISAPDRRTRSLSLLAVARGGELDAASVRRLGRAAAGGGDLPDDLRPLAAWHHLAIEGRLNDVLPTLLNP
jgi:hypothetical protein